MLKDGDLQNLLNLILMCALLQIYTTEKVILNIFHWNLLVWQKMHKRDFKAKRRFALQNMHKIPSPTGFACYFLQVMDTEVLTDFKEQ